MNEAEVISRFKEGNLHVGELIKRIHEHLDKRANREMQKNGLTFTQFKLLFVLYHTEGGEATLKELEKFFHTAQSTMAGIAVRLEKGKFIESFTDGCDKRVKRLRITDKGQQLCTESRERLEENEKFLLSPLTQEEQRQFFVFLQKICINLIENT